MLKCKIKKGHRIRTRIKGTAGDLATETAMLVNLTYFGIKKNNPDAAAEYRRKLLVCLLAPNSPTWTLDAADTNVGDEKEG